MFASLFETLGALPVAGIAAAVSEKVLNGTVTVVASATGSGKTLLLPPSLAYASGEQVVVLVPRRFLAVNAAETVADLSGLTVGEEIGYAVGAQSGEESRQGDSVLYCTYGYAIASDLILRAKTIVLDEVHEASLDMSICRALLHRRLAAGEKVNVLEMSATINAERQAAYWQQVAPVEVVEIDGRTFPCERRHRPAQPIEEAVRDLIDEGRKGVLVFRPGRGEVEETAEAIRALVGEGVEVAEIYGELDYSARKQAVAAPQGKAKVLVGTNVVESGANIPWLDAGVTCGTAKEMSVRPETGATFLGLIKLPRWRLDQQEGRVKRFRDGIFVLCAQDSYESREAETTPEIRRLPLTELVMHCAGFGIRAEDLTFDYAPEEARIVEAETKLQRLGLIDTNCRLTKAGRWVSGMPVGPETGAMLWHAKNTGVLGAALPLAAVIEVDGIRKDFREPHGLNGDSDWLDAMAAFNLAYSEKDSSQRKEWMEQYNISYKRFEAAKEMLHDLRRRFNGDASSTMTASDEQLRLCIIAGFITNLFSGTYRMTPIADDYSVYNLGNGSAVYPTRGYAIGQLRTIQPRDRRKASFTILEKVTDVSMDDVLAVAKVRPSLITMEEKREKVGYYQFQLVKTKMLFGAIRFGGQAEASPLTAEEEAEKAAFEATRTALRQKLEVLNTARQELGLSNLQFGDTSFNLGSYGPSYAYTAEEVARAEKENEGILNRRRAELEAARQKAERIAAIRPQFEALSQRRQDAGLGALYLRSDSVDDGWRSYEYTEETLVALNAEMETELVEKKAQKERAAREAVKRTEAEKAGRERVAGFNQRLEAIGRNALTIDSDGDVSWYGCYRNIRDMSALDVVEEELAELEASAKQRAKQQAERQEAIARGKSLIEKLNLRREALGWRPIETFEEDFYYDDLYVGYVDDKTIQEAEQEVIAEERKRADEAARVQNASTNTSTLADLLREKFRVGRR